MKITNNLLIIGTASSLGKQQRVLQRVQEEEFERNRQDNLTLKRRLDRLGRETNDLKNSFVSLVGSNLAHPLESHVNLTHLQTVSALTDKALAVKVKVLDTSFVRMYVCTCVYDEYMYNLNLLSQAFVCVCIFTYVCFHICM